MEMGTGMGKGKLRGGLREDLTDLEMARSKAD